MSCSWIFFWMFPLCLGPGGAVAPVAKICIRKRFILPFYSKPHALQGCISAGTTVATRLSQFVWFKGTDKNIPIKNEKLHKCQSCDQTRKTAVSLKADLQLVLLDFYFIYMIRNMGRGRTHCPSFCCIICSLRSFWMGLGSTICKSPSPAASLFFLHGPVKIQEPFMALPTALLPN